MKKLIWLVCLSMLLGLLAGCQTDPAGTQPSGGMATTGTAEPTGTTVPQLTDPVDIRPLPPENPGSSLIDYDPDRQIYITGENVYVDYYLGITNVPSINVNIYSKEYIDPADISVAYPVELPLLVSISQNDELERKTEYMTDDGVATGLMPYYVYYTYRGGDPAQLETNTELLEDFMALKPEDLPEFYVYTIGVHFVNVLELEEPVTLEKLDITIGDLTYETKLGRVRLFPQEAFPTDAVEIRRRGGYTGYFFDLYNDGIFDITAYKLEEVPEDITITGLRMLEEESEILDISVEITSGGQSVETKWDGKSPIYLYKGDRIYIRAVLKNELTARLLSWVHLQPIVEYTVDATGEKICEVTTYLGVMNRNYYEYYAIIFDGVDMEPYYREYLYKKTISKWIEAYRDR